MLSGLRQHLTYANVVSTACLFIVLGGSAVAAVTLQRGSVKGKHIAKNAVTAPKVKNGSLRAQDFAAGQIPPGPQGERGEQGPTGLQGPPGEQGPAGSDAQFNGAAAGGDLTGTYPDPSIGPDAIGGAEVLDGALGGPDINEASLGQVPSAGSANSANTATRATAADVAAPLAYIRVNADGTAFTGTSKDASVTKYMSSGTPATGVYCITTPYTQGQIDTLSVTLRLGNIFTLDDHVAQASVSISAPPNCPEGQDVIVTTWDISAGARVDHGFFLAIFGTPP